MTTPTPPSAMEEAAKIIEASFDEFPKSGIRVFSHKTLNANIARALSERDERLVTTQDDVRDLTEERNSLRMAMAGREGAIEYSLLADDVRELRAQLREKNSMLDALGKECDKLEEDREYNAGLVRERERELKEEGRSGDRREAEMAEQRDLAYAKYDEAQQDALRLNAEVERVKEQLASSVRDVKAVLGEVERLREALTEVESEHSPGGPECREPYSPCGICNAIRLLPRRPAPAKTP